MEGSWDRGSQQLRLAAESRLRHEHAFGPERSRHVRVVWHLRTGDNQVLARNQSLHTLKRSIDDGLPSRQAVHYVATVDAKQLYSMYPWMASLGFRPLPDAPDGLPALRLLVHSDVLISTGSSYATAAAALAPAGRQIHFFFPPKELGMHTFSGLRAATRHTFQHAADNLQPEEIQRNGWWRTYFMRTNTVPLGIDGRALPRYKAKESAMLASIDAHRAVDRSVADREYEFWLPARSTPAAHETHRRPTRDVDPS